MPLSQATELDVFTHQWIYTLHGHHSMHTNMIRTISYVLSDFVLLCSSHISKSRGQLDGCSDCILGASLPFLQHPFRRSVLEVR